MSSSEQHTPSQPETNGLGIAGFICSIVGFVTCGLLSPLGLLFSLIALFRSPRGFAIAGTVLGAIGSLFFFLVGMAMLLPLLAVVGIGAAAFEAMAPLIEASARIDEYQVTHQALPNEEEGTKLIGGITDTWNRALKYTPADDGSFTISSAGEDGQFGNDDDVDFNSSMSVTITDPDDAAQDEFDEKQETQETNEGGDKSAEDSNSSEASQDDPPA